VLGNYRNDVDCRELAERSDNFVIGLTSISPTVTAPTLWNYAVCGQYPGAVPAGATVNLTCTSDMPAYRYLIVQFPITGYANFCELEVFVRRKSFTNSLQYLLENYKTNIHRLFSRVTLA